MKRKNMAIRLIRKSARGFRTGEWLYLTDCRSEHYGRVQGSYLISEIKNMSDEGRTFMCRGVPTMSTHDWVALEFTFQTQLYRIAGEPLPYIITEEEPYIITEEEYA